jgi:hypothetical protein
MHERVWLITAAALVAAVIIAAVANSSHAAEIKETTKLTLSGPGLSQPIEVTDDRVLALSNVFSGTFIGTPAYEKPDAASPRYTIAFDVQWREGVKVAAPAVLVVDEVGYLTYGTDAANMLFHVVNDRHRRRRGHGLHHQQAGDVLGQSPPRRRPRAGDHRPRPGARSIAHARRPVLTDEASPA